MSVFTWRAHSLCRLALYWVGGSTRCSLLVLYDYCNFDEIAKSLKVCSSVTASNPSRETGPPSVQMFDASHRLVHEATIVSRT